MKLKTKVSVSKMPENCLGLQVTDLKAGVLYRKWLNSSRRYSASLYYIAHLVCKRNSNFVVQLDVGGGLTFWDLSDYVDDRFVVAKDVDVNIEISWKGGYSG